MTVQKTSFSQGIKMFNDSNNDDADFFPFFASRLLTNILTGQRQGTNKNKFNGGYGNDVIYVDYLTEVLGTQMSIKSSLMEKH